MKVLFAEIGTQDHRATNRMLRVRSPGCRLEQLDLLGHDERPELRGETLYEILVRKHGRPMRAPVGVVLKLPQVDELVDRSATCIRWERLARRVLTSYPRPPY